MKGVTHMGGWTDALKKKRWRNSCWAGNPGTSLPAEVLRHILMESLTSHLGRGRLGFMLLGLDQVGRCHSLEQQPIIMAVLICRFSHAVRRAGALCRLCVRSAHLRGLWWEIEHDQHAQENPWTKTVPGSAATHPSKPSVQGRELLSLQSKLWRQALLLVEDLALSKPC